jgi:hypothetical protein
VASFDELRVDALVILGAFFNEENKRSLLACFDTKKGMFLFSTQQKKFNPSMASLRCQRKN